MAEQLVETVLGPVRVEDLGIILPHEHVPLRLGASEEEETLEAPECYRDRLEEQARAALCEARAFDAKTLVEVTPIGCCRDIPMMQRLSRDTGMHIVASTGFYLDDRFPRSMQSLSVEAMADLFERELTDGIAGTGVRPWVIKVSGQPQATERELRVFRAAAIASNRTGAIITTHSSHANRAHFDLLLAAGADPARIYIGHTESGAGTVEHLDIARRGGRLIFTCWGFAHQDKQEAFAEQVLALVEAGFASAVLLSIDYAIGYAANPLEPTGFQYESTALTFACLFRDALGKLREKGIGDALIHQFLADNPREMLTRSVR